MNKEKLEKILEALKVDMDERGDRVVHASFVKIVLEALLEPNSN